ncbi:MAG: hypothetical protein WC214_07810, partial [Candidatus Omnitrophota bacterium]
MLTKKSKNKKSITLIELITAISLTALAGTAVYGLLSSGVKVWGAYNEIKNYGDVSIFFEKIG